ncbi:MAG: sodium:proton antiporter [Chloroflexota bacterium]|nr:sodium:proton antiporter [Chloroflexota bacterium]
MFEQSPELLARQLALLLLGAAVVGMLARRVGVPYAVALVVGGLLVEESHAITVPTLDPALVLFGFLPPLLFDAAFRLDTREARLLLRPILLLALPGTFFTALVVGGIVAIALHLPLAVGLLFGSLVAATDPVAIIGVFKSLRAPPRLAAIAEGESLINDGVAITMYTAVLGLALTGTGSATDVVRIFGQEVVGGVLIGGLLGFAFSRLTAMVDDHLIEMMLSLALAYGSYAGAQWVHASGPLACVAAGVIHGSYGREMGMSENTRRLLDDLWEFLGFVANAIVFVLVGFTANLASLFAQAWPATAAILAVLLARVVLLGAPGLLLKDHHLKTSGAERVVLAWGGLRGALTITLALALPPETPDRELLVAMSFGVVLFTLLVQGMSLPLLLRQLGLVQPRKAVPR